MNNIVKNQQVRPEFSSDALDKWGILAHGWLVGTIKSGKFGLPQGRSVVESTTALSQSPLIDVLTSLKYSGDAGAIGTYKLCQYWRTQRPGFLTVHLYHALLLTSCALGACNAVEIAPPRQDTLDVQVEFYLSGGFAGNRQSLKIDGTGLIVVQDNKRGNIARGQLDPVRLAEIRAAFMKIDAEAGTATNNWARVVRTASNIQSRRRSGANATKSLWIQQCCRPRPMARS